MAPAHVTETATRVATTRPLRLAADLVRLMRPRQWYKNALLLVGLVFSGLLFEPAAALTALGAFAVFCAVSGGVYALNDTLDAAQDRLHPRKRARPVASGRVPAPVAMMWGAGLLTSSVAAAWMIAPAFAIVTILFVALQATYIFVLKHHVFMDLLSIATGLVLRAVAGVVAIGAVVSPWLLLCTFFLALFLGLGKRRNEILLLGERAGSHRKNLAEYTPALLDQAITVVTSALVISYCLYVFQRGDLMLAATVPFALYGLFRYLYLTRGGDAGGEPEELLADRATLVNAALWTGIVVAALYAPAGALTFSALAAAP